MVSHTNEREYLLAAFEEEDIRVDAVRDGAAEEWHPVEDQRRLVRVLEEQLAEDVDDDGEDDKGHEAGRDHHRGGSARDHLDHGRGQSGKEAHAGY